MGPSGSPGKAHRSLNSEGKWWIRSVRKEVGGPQKSCRRSPRRQRREQGFESPRRGKSYDAWRDSGNSWASDHSAWDEHCSGWDENCSGRDENSSGWDENCSGWDENCAQHVCRYFPNGSWDSSCYSSHDWLVDDRMPSKPSGIRFRLDQDAAQVLCGPSWAWPDTRTGTGPMRPRIVGNLEELGGGDGDWEPQGGLDLWWEGDCWTSTVISLEPDRDVEFCVVRLDQAESHPGLMQPWERVEMHDARHFTWGPKLKLRSPRAGEVAEVFLRASNCDCSASWASPPVWLRSREELVAGPDRPLPWSDQPPGTQRCFTFDASSGTTLKFSLYLPTGYKHQPDDVYDDMERWPLVVFLHSMHGKIEGDNNLFFESDTALRLLQGDDRCPATLKQKCIFLAPQCPIDAERGDAAGVWLRRGWYEDSQYDEQVEVALVELTALVRDNYRVDWNRVSIMGSSMGAYAALELTSRRPYLFSAAVLVAAHYDLEPMGPLVLKLADQELPMWFIHAENDNVCPFEEVEVLVQKLRRYSRAEIRLTRYEDNWSGQGHCADRVAFWAHSWDPAVPACGEEVFQWLTSRA